MTGTRRCFVVSPIGQPGTPTREHADDVFRFIIEPALRQCDISPVRGDQLMEPGRISEQMYRALFDADLCVAVLAERNPNVYYELALAQAAGRPVVLLVPKGETLPFDVQDLRCVMYDLRPQPLFDGVYTAEVVEHVRSIERSGWRSENPFVALGFPATTDTEVSYLDHVGKSVPPDAWVAMVGEAREVFELMGVSLHSWRRTQEVATALAEKAAAGCAVRIMLVDPENPALPAVFAGPVADRTLVSVREDIERSRAFFAGVAQAEPRVQLRMVRQGLPFFQSTRIDNQVLYIPYLNAEPTAYSPSWRARPGTSLYTSVVEEFQALWAANG